MTPTPKTLPLTVLLYEGPIARAYLSALYAAGFKVKKIISLINVVDAVTQKPIAPKAPDEVRIPLAEKIQRQQMHYWPRFFHQKYPQACQAIQDASSTLLNLPKQLWENLVEDMNYNAYSDCIERVLINTLKDPALFKKLSNEPAGTILYTGGGIVPKSLLNIPGLRFLHIHPGYLPDVRGADGVLWSSLIKQETAATCFYMAPGIDTGDIIYREKFSCPQFKIGQDHFDLKSRYRLVFSFYDPFLRAAVLLRTIQQVADPDRLSLQDLPAFPQDTSTGTTYHFMHDRLKKAALEQLFF
ncbi:MAG: formyltransferase family protein [Cyanobacteria bacterium P01_H01_bin.74]